MLWDYGGSDCCKSKFGKRNISGLCRITERIRAATGIGICGMTFTALVRVFHRRLLISRCAIETNDGTAGQGSQPEEKA